jgi:uncharacterized Zn-finger protein
LLPVVFASRSISCRRKPSRLPTGSASFAASASRKAAMCAVNRSSSSPTSSLSARIAISMASRCGSTAMPPASFSTFSRSRVRCISVRSGARAANRPTAASIRLNRSAMKPASRAPSCSRITCSALAAASTTTSSSAAVPSPSASSSRPMRITSGMRRTALTSISPPSPWACWRRLSSAA